MHTLGAVLHQCQRRTSIFKTFGDIIVNRTFKFTGNFSNFFTHSVLYRNSRSNIQNNRSLFFFHQCWQLILHFKNGFGANIITVYNQTAKPSQCQITFRSIDTTWNFILFCVLRKISLCVFWFLILVIPV